ncbi:lysine--tRNA ligase, partial [Candidatus Micrarchaeota archaeon]
VADTSDAFDSIPASMEEYEGKLRAHLGKPLSRVPDPTGSAESIGEYFLKDAEDAMKKFEVKPKILEAHELYKKGKYDKYALLFFERLEDVRRAVYESSLGRELPKWWSPIMPICKKCGRIATTRVTSFSFENGGEYKYACDREVKYTKGCGATGVAGIKDHEYKIVWRLDWPARQDFLNASIEGGGVDHFTRGGSWDTAVAIHKRIFKKEPPVGYRFGFVLLKGKKYSKSKGEGMGIVELTELIPPEVLKYALLRPDIQENKNIETSGEAMLRLCEDYLRASEITVEPEVSRADRKRAVAFELSTKKRKFKTFSDILLLYQLYRDWKIVGKLTDRKSAEYLRPYIEGWVRKQFLPEEYSFTYKPKEIRGDVDLVLEFASRLDKKQTAVDIHNLVFEVARGKGKNPADLFRHLYGTLINQERGPKLGKLVKAVGVEKVKKDILELHKKER